MIVLCDSFKRMAEKFQKEHLSVAMFGCGVLGRVTTPEILRQYELIDNVVCYADNDQRLWGNSLDLYGRKIPVVSPDTLRERGKIAILLNVSRYSAVLEQLNAYPELAEVHCYLIPMMCIDNFRNAELSGAVKDTKDAVIPKVINYVWIGGGSFSDSQKKCMESWRRFCPDYKIRQWDETNYDFRSNSYMAEACDRKAFAFASDYAKLDILYRYGGFCLDTDVELVKPLDELRYQEAFCGVEKWQVLNFGGMSGAQRGSRAIRAYLDARQNLHFIRPDGRENRMTCGYYDTKTAINNGYQLNGTIQKIDGMNIYPSDYFHPYDYMSGQTEITENTYSIHHFGGSWLTPEMMESNRTTRENYQALHEEALRNGCAQ